MFKKLAITAVAVLALSGTGALAAGGAGKVKDVDFSFEGRFRKRYFCQRKVFILSFHGQ